MSKLKVFFNQKPLHRERQADTAKFATKFFEVISPLKQNVDNLKTLQTQKRSVVLKIITYLIGKIPIINLRRISHFSGDADYIYTWWDIPLFSKKPFIIELDNPYILTLYNAFAFKLYKPIIKKLLLSKKCKKIACISEACRKSFIEEMWGEFEDKTVVLYPRIRDWVIKSQGNTHEVIQFLFVWLTGKSKWLYELLVAFHSVKSHKIELNVIGFKNPEIEAQYGSDSRIKFLWQLPRQEILNVFMPACDVLLFPTYLESFGMVALEALSRGLGIITTNIYALPEMVVDGYNGKLLPHPFFAPNKFWFVDIQDILPTLEERLNNQSINAVLVENLIESIEVAIRDCKSWKENSRKLYEEKFSEKAWEKSFISLFE